MVMTICVALTEEMKTKQNASSHLSKEYIFKGEEYISTELNDFEPIRAKSFELYNW
jgi:hypothetical protein